MNITDIIILYENVNDIFIFDIGLKSVMEVTLVISQTECKTQHNLSLEMQRFEFY